MIDIKQAISYEEDKQAEEKLLELHISLVLGDKIPESDFNKILEDAPYGFEIKYNYSSGEYSLLRYLSAAQGAYALGEDGYILRKSSVIPLYLSRYKTNKQWLTKYYPIPAKHATVENALDASILKWQGIYQDPEGAKALYHDGESCALCHAYKDNCSDCAITKAVGQDCRDAYIEWRLKDAAHPMLNLLGTVKTMLNTQKYSFKEGDKVLVRNSNSGDWMRRYFSHISRGYDDTDALVYYCFYNGDEWTSRGAVLGWKYCKPYTE
jgi:hypothetical protein